MYSCRVLIVTKFTEFRHVRNLLYFKTVLVPFCLTMVQNMEERNWNVLLPGDFLCRIFLAFFFLPSFRSVLFSLFSAVLMFHFATQVSLYSAHQLICYLAGPVLLLAICIGCVLLGRHQGHTWSTPGYPIPFASSVCPGFPMSYHSLLCYTAWGSEPLVFSIHLQCLDRVTQNV